MKNLTLLMLLLLILHLPSQAQGDKLPERLALTVGILQGGGSLVGADLEVLLTNRFGVQVGAGLVGYGAALTYHLRPGLRSPHLALTYWSQGMDDGFVQNVIGVSYIYRGRRGFSAQLGLGRPLSQGPAWPRDRQQPPIMLLYSIGWALFA